MSGKSKDPTRRAAELIAAYGADERRWPGKDRAGGHFGVTLAQPDPDLAKAIDEANALDAALSASPDLTVDAALIGRVMAQAGAARQRWRRLRLWWAGAALAGLGLAGAAAGAAAAVALTPPAQSFELYDGATAFGGADIFSGG